MGEGDDILGCGATVLASRIAAGDLSAAEVVDAHIARIEETAGDLNAVVIPLFDEAREAAAIADAAVRGGDALGPLHGVPVTVKEQYRVKGTQVTLGATKRIGNVSCDEGPLVAELRRAGAIILGKTNIIQTLAGWESVNPVYGRTDNPWDPERSPGGSSGGEAAVVAVGGSALGLAGDFGGSIRIPAHFCGVHGFKPTSHRLSNADFPAGLLTAGQELFIPQPGPIARTVADLALAMEVFAPTSMSSQPDLVPPVAWSDPDLVRVDGLRIGVYTDNGYFPSSPGVRRTVGDAAEALRALGATVVDVSPPNPVEGVRLFLGAASAGGARDYLDLLDGEKPIPQVAGIIRGNRIPGPLRPLVAKAMERKGQHHLARQIRELGPRSAREYFDLVDARNRYRAAFWAILDDAGLDALICPPAALPAFTHGSSEHLLCAVTDAFIYNVIGAPAGVVSTSCVRPDEQGDRPATEDLADVAAREVDAGSTGLPLGVQVVARHWHDDVVLAVMAALEETFKSQADYPAGALVSSA